LADGDGWNDGPSSDTFGEYTEGDFGCYGCEREEADYYSQFKSCGAFFCDVEGQYGLCCLGGEEEGYGCGCQKVEFFGEFGCGGDCCLVSFLAGYFVIAILDFGFSCLPGFLCVDLGGSI